MRYIERRIREFQRLGKKGETIFDFSPFLNLRLKATIKTELVFCICTANSSAVSGLRVQKALEHRDPEDLKPNEWENLLRRSGVRFYRKKAMYIRMAIRVYEEIEDLIRSGAREELVKLVKGLGYKEASHLLRNVGNEYAIIDRHVMRWLMEKGYLKKEIKLTPKRYEKLEALLKRIANRKRMSLSELDLWIWASRTGMVLK